VTYRVYGYTGCIWCDKAKEFLGDVGENFVFVPLETAEEREAFLDERGIEAPNRTWPRVYEDDKLVGGYRQLLEKFMPV